MSATATFPRAIRSPRIFANAKTTPEVIASLTTSFEDFKASHNAKLNNVQRGFDDINSRLASMGMNGGLPSDVPADPEYTQLFASWFRHGDAASELKAANREGVRQQVHAAMSAGSSTDGGYLAPIEWDRKVTAALQPLSPMRRLATVVSTGVRGYTTLWNKGGWGSGWVGETAARPVTATASLASLEFSHGEIYANPAITSNLLDDADFPLEQWVETELASEFSKQESVAFLSGDGVNKPRGLLTYAVGGSAASLHPGGAIATFAGKSAGEIGNADTLVDFVYSLPAPYRQNAKWLMNSMTAARIAKMKDGQGNYLWRETYVAGQPATLLGYAVEIDENMPNVGADALPIAFGDFRAGYVINDRFGVRVLRDPYTNKPFVHFYTTKRVGGGLRDPNAIKFYRIAAS